MNADVPNHYYIVKPLAGAVPKPLTRRSPDKMILHFGTNDMRSHATPKIMADSIVNIVTQIREDSPGTAGSISAILVTNDKNDLPAKAIQINNILKGYCSRNRIPFLSNSNMNASHLNMSGLHLNRHGSLALQQNLLDFAKTISDRLYPTQSVIPTLRGFKLAALNVRSLVIHIDELRVLLATSPIDVLATNETWLDSTISDNDVYIPGYDIIGRGRAFKSADGKTYGGVCFYVRSSINFIQRKNMSTDDLKNLCIQTQKPNSKPFLVVTWYRPPNSNVDKFNYFENFIDMLDDENVEYYLLGDLYCDLGLPDLEGNSRSSKASFNSMVYIN